MRSGQLPVHWFGALRDEGVVDRGERTGAEEAVVSRQWARVCRLDCRETGQPRGQVASVAAPEQGHQRPVPFGQTTDGPFGYGLPSFRAVRTRLAVLDGEASVEQQHALVRPRGEIAARRRGQTEVLGVLPKDVLQASG